MSYNYIDSSKMPAVKIEEKEGTIIFWLPGSAPTILTMEAAKEINLQLSAAIMKTEGVFQT